MVVRILDNYLSSYFVAFQSFIRNSILMENLCLLYIRVLVEKNQKLNWKNNILCYFKCVLEGYQMSLLCVGYLINSNENISHKYFSLFFMHLSKYYLIRYLFLYLNIYFFISLPVLMVVSCVFVEGKDFEFALSTYFQMLT